jgi:hypothetical protein
MWYKSLNNYTVVDSESNSNYFDSRGLDFVNLLNQIKLFVNRGMTLLILSSYQTILVSNFRFLEIKGTCWYTDLIFLRFYLNWPHSCIENLKQLRNKMKRQGYLLADASRITSDLARLIR